MEAWGEEGPGVAMPVEEAGRRRQGVAWVGRGASGGLDQDKKMSEAEEERPERLEAVGWVVEQEEGATEEVAPPQSPPRK